MKQRAFYLPLMALLLLLGACHKDNDGRVELILEPFGSTTKLTLAGDTVATWDNGDLINFNGAEVAITREENGHAYISDAYAQTTNSACFPASLKEGSLAGDNVTFTLPEVYHYRTSGGTQQLELPMVARADNGKPLRFRHLTAALCFTISNDRSETLVIDSLSVSSTAYQLSGERSVNMNDNLASLSPVATGGSVSRVTIFFDRERLELAPGASRKVMIPVLPVGDGNQFTVTVAARYQGTRYNYTKTQSSGGALARNVLAYANMSLNNSPTFTGNLFTGNGTDVSPYVLDVTMDLIAFAEACNGQWTLPGSSTKYASKCFLINKPLDMTGISINTIANFTGSSFDGGGNIIRNLTINNSSAYCGFFKNLSNNTSISGLKLYDVTLKNTGYTTQMYFGAICADILTSSLSGCEVNGLTAQLGSPSSVYFGAITGHAEGSFSISSCSVEYSQTITGIATTMYFGGVLGYCEKGATSNNPTISNCTVTNDGLSFSSTSTMNAGGMIGYVTNETITMSNCHWSSSMSFDAGSANLSVGGLIGYMLRATSQTCSLTASNCTVNGSITANTTGNKYIGAYVGSLSTKRPTLSFTDCSTTTGLSETGN